MRINFSELFNVVNGMVSPKAQVKIGGITMSPGVSFGGGVSFGNVNLTQFAGKDLEVERLPNGIIEIKGAY